MTAYVRDVPITVTDGNLDIDFTATVDQPKVSAIEVIPAADARPRSRPGLVHPRSGRGTFAFRNGPPSARSPYDRRDDGGAIRPHFRPPSTRETFTMVSNGERPPFRSTATAPQRRARGRAP
ncbi:hypothetical protein [Georgenia sp. SUBG003]|uniref:hypothetical protein n=1 Tax=Georgenia sp. SUBG003 TaxID=1497974 RepID=UPI003AB128AF